MRQQAEEAIQDKNSIELQLRKQISDLKQSSQRLSEDSLCKNWEYEEKIKESQREASRIES